MRRIEVQLKGFEFRRVYRIVTFNNLAAEWQNNLYFLVLVEDVHNLTLLTKMNSSGLSDLFIVTSNREVYSTSILPIILLEDGEISEHDVVAVSPHKNEVQVLFRSSDLHHTVFLTNRCNSNCLMCSQPPTPQDDSWLITEAIEVAKHIKLSPALIGFTGGEPLLLGKQLRELFNTYRMYHPNIEIDLLTNGRLLSDRDLAVKILKGLEIKVNWMVPLYGHADFLHDFVVQAPGAFEQTLNGLLNLQEFGQPIQLRIVLIEPVLEILPKLCDFISRNLPFVREVALMGCEPIGFALANRDICEVNIQDWSPVLEEAALILLNSRIEPVLMNIPLCSISSTLRKYAHKSISDWKQTYAEECKSCIVKTDCSGLFSWYEKGWKPSAISRVTE